MDKIDLDINNYNLDDILNLFKIGHDFTEEDLKKAKKIVLKTHPDKSGLKPNIFLFYSKAYKILFSIWNFKSKQISKNINYNIDDFDEKNHINDFSYEKDKAKILDNLFENKKMKDPSHFNSWFNKEFEKAKIQEEAEIHGYGDWLRSNEDIEENLNINPALIEEAFENKKRQIRDLVVHKELNEIYTDNIGSSSIIGETPEYYTSDIFSSLHYEDLKKAHTECVIPVTIEDYHKVPKFVSMDEYKTYRNSQNIVPLSEIQANEYLHQKNNIEREQTNYRAYKIAKQTEETQKKQEFFWHDLMKITNK